MPIVYFVVFLFYVFCLVHVLKFGLDFTQDNDDKWYGGVAMWFVWCIGWLFGPPLVLVYICGVL